MSNVIGSGILLMPAIVARLAPEYWALMSVWLVGGLLAFAGAMAYAELATMRPRAGGEYVYLRAAYGPLPAFLTGWTSFVAGFSGAIAAAAVGLAGFLGSTVPVFGDQTPWFSLSLGALSLTISPQNLTAVAIIAVFSLVHAVGLGPGPRRPEHARRDQGARARRVRGRGPDVGPSIRRPPRRRRRWPATA